MSPNDPFAIKLGSLIVSSVPQAEEVGLKRSVGQKRVGDDETSHGRNSAQSSSDSSVSGGAARPARSRAKH